MSTWLPKPPLRRGNDHADQLLRLRHFESAARHAPGVHRRSRHRDERVGRDPVACVVGKYGHRVARLRLRLAASSCRFEFRRRRSQTCPPQRHPGVRSASARRRCRRLPSESRSCRRRCHSTSPRSHGFCASRAQPCTTGFRDGNPTRPMRNDCVRCCACWHGRAYRAPTGSTRGSSGDPSASSTRRSSTCSARNGSTKLAIERLGRTDGAGSGRTASAHIDNGNIIPGVESD